MRRMRKRIRRRAAGRFFQAPLDWAFLVFLLIFALIWRLVNIYANAQFPCGTRQRFWMGGYWWDISLLEMFGWTILLLAIAWVCVWLAAGAHRQILKRATEALLIGLIGFSWAQNWAGYFPYSAAAQVVDRINEVRGPTPLFGGAFYEEIRSGPEFLGADGEWHPYTLPEPERPEEGHPLGTEVWGNTLYGFGCSCLNRSGREVAAAHRIRDAILATGIEPHPDYLTYWAELPPRPEEPSWCPLPGDPIGGWPRNRRGA